MYHMYILSMFYSILLKLNLLAIIHLASVSLSLTITIFTYSAFTDRPPYIRYIYFIVWFSQFFTFGLSIIIAFFILLTETVVEVSRKL